MSGADVGQTYSVGLRTMVIGRDKVDIVIAESEVSRRHAKFDAVPLGYVIEDLNSSNGTLLNGVRIKGPTQVTIGDRIQIGRTVLVLAQHDELAERVARMQRLEAMATLAGGIAHDFNNALAAILGNIEIVNDELAPGGEGARGLEEIRAAAADATALARRLLRLGRADAVPFVAVPLEELCTRTASMARKRSQGPLEIIVKVPSHLHAHGSYDELHQALLNLCINAVDAMPKGGRLVIAARDVVLNADLALAYQMQPGGAVEITVTDNGCGMDEATMQRAFEPFFTTKTRDKGTGLGLAMIHSTIRRHRGAIDVKSVVGAGTTFRVTLPLASD
ncbi:MAG: ATP-binding protein [Kofleriaceae bacterium]